MSAHPGKPMGRTEWMLLGALSVLWGGSFFFGKVAVADLHPFTVVLGRVAGATAVLLTLVACSRHRMPREARAWGLFGIMALLNNVIPFSLIFWGETRIDSGLASILNATTPLFTVVVAHMGTTDEKLTRQRAAGVVLGFAGVAWMMGPEALAGVASDRMAQAAVLGAAFSYALAGVFGRRFRGLPPLVLATGQVTAATVLMTPLVLTVHRSGALAAASAAAWLSVAGLALLCTALAYLIYFRILATAGATNLLLVTFLIPVSAVFLGCLFLGEVLTSRQIAGMALIGLALAAVDGRPLAHLRRNFARAAPLGA